MSRKSLTLALAAIVTLGAVALSSSSASAFHAAGGGIGGAHASGGGAKMLGGGGLNLKSKPLVNGIVINKPMVTGIKINPWPKFGHHWNWHYPRFWWWRYSWRRPYWIAPVVATGGVAGAATYASTPATNTCTCLTKQYTPQGAVVFKDVCTNEMAMNPPLSASPAAYMPEQPQQQGYLQPQPSQVR